MVTKKRSSGGPGKRGKANRRKVRKRVSDTVKPPSRPRPQKPPKPKDKEDRDE